MNSALSHRPTSSLEALRVAVPLPVAQAVRDRAALSPEVADAEGYGLDMTARAPMDTHTQAMSASLLGRGDVSSAFSHSGSTRDVVGNQQLARDNGAETICVTSAARSPIVASSSVVLLTASEDTLVSNLRSKIVQLFVLELLIQGCARELGTAARVALERTTAAVVGKMY
jgi:DNA-binding MurR/RpiR family transcriptional regulator